MRTFQHYDIAFRKNGDKIFSVVPQPQYGWTADPFLVEYKGELYLFAEVFLYLSERNGVIGFCKYENGRFGEWTITMDRHWHLSYPNVFVEDDKLFMIPETYQLEEVSLYELIEFPNKWVKIKTYVSNVEYCDTTILDYKDGNKYMFSFERKAGEAGGNGYLFQMKDDEVIDKHFLSDSLLGTRCGGKIIKYKDSFIRVGQNSVKEYGAGLLFYEIDSVWPVYKEHEIRRLEPKDIQVDSDRLYTGLHTYNELNGIEVIDLKYVSSTKEEEEASDRTRKVFLNKY